MTKSARLFFVKTVIWAGASVCALAGCGARTEIPGGADTSGGAGGASSAEPCGAAGVWTFVCGVPTSACGTCPLIVSAPVQVVSIPAAVTDGASTVNIALVGIPSVAGTAQFDPSSCTMSQPPDCNGVVDQTWDLSPSTDAVLHDEIICVGDDSTGSSCDVTDCGPAAACPGTKQCVPPCADGLPCVNDQDCGSGVCTSGAWTCAAPACAPTCATASPCGADGDCASNHCEGGTCTL